MNKERQELSGSGSAGADMTPREQGGLPAPGRRTTLLRMAAVAAPVVAALPAHAQRLAQGSAYRAAMKDAEAIPVGYASTGDDGWIRTTIAFGVIRQSSSENSNIVHSNVYRVGQSGSYRYFQVAELDPPDQAGSQLFLENNQAFFTTQLRLVLVLFVEGSLNEQGTWPEYDARGALQALHCSSWSSAFPGVTPPYNCNGTTV